MSSTDEGRSPGTASKVAAGVARLGAGATDADADAARAGEAVAPGFAPSGSRAAGTGAPASRASALRSRATWLVKAATSARAVSTVVWACASVRPEAAPRAWLRSVSSYDFWRLRRVSCASCRRRPSASRVSQALATSATRLSCTLRRFSVVRKNSCSAASLRFFTRPKKSIS